MYPVDLHAHTIASTHAYSTVSEYFQQAKKQGIKLFAITDHGPDMDDAPHEWHFSNLPVIPRMIDGVGILYGIEANIKNIKGETDCSEKMSKKLDIVLAGFHEPVMGSLGIVDNTKALIATITSGAVQMITHPGNPKYPIDFAEVAKVAAACHVALEMNNSSFIHSRVGSEKNCIEIAKEVRDAGGLIALGSDSHIASSLGKFDRVLEVLTQIDFPEERILNITPRRVLDFLKSHGKKEIPEFNHF
ncbi:MULTISPECIES: phosphatase [Proteus]|uniref:phosphatase n=1 Tax=Proteus TaxID=583 RepID=UPI000F510AB0|nr:MULTISPECIES: phosphatase [Proteus]AYY80357.1 phosphatase [Proteus vulgaris]NBN84988.1 PHP domain-containing protein [Proteus sp. G2300]